MAGEVSLCNSRKFPRNSLSVLFQASSTGSSLGRVGERTEADSNQCSTFCTVAAMLSCTEEKTAVNTEMHGYCPPHPHATPLPAHPHAICTYPLLPHATPPTPICHTPYPPTYHAPTRTCHTSSHLLKLCVAPFIDECSTGM